MLSYPFVDELTAAGNRIGWLTTVKGVRTVWTAAAPRLRPAQGCEHRRRRRAGADRADLHPRRRPVAWVRGGGATTPTGRPRAGCSRTRRMRPSSRSSTVWTGRRRRRGGQDRRGRCAGAVGEGRTRLSSRTARSGPPSWTARAKPAKLFFDRGKDGDLAWSPDGGRLAFVSHRGDHSLHRRLRRSRQRPLTWLAPSTGSDDEPVWSPDGAPRRLHPPSGRRRRARAVADRRAAPVVDLRRRCRHRGRATRSGTARRTSTARSPKFRAGRCCAGRRATR